MVVAGALLATHTAILYGLDVPDAFGLTCGRGVLTPVCNAASFVDQKIFSVSHMYFPTNGGACGHMGAGSCTERRVCLQAPRALG